MDDGLASAKTPAVVSGGSMSAIVELPLTGANKLTKPFFRAEDTQ